MSGPLRRIDRIDERGDIREHVLRTGSEDRTLCGLTVWDSQQPSRNGECRNCERIARTKKLEVEPPPRW